VTTTTMERPGLAEVDMGGGRFGAKVLNGELLVELAAREAGRRKHKSWKRVSAMELIDVLTELGFKMVVS
jgi:hypothetical protein